jgi:hypothetical protein
VFHEVTVASTLTQSEGYGMKRIGLFLSAVVLMSGLASCNGGDSSTAPDTVDFNGTWRLTDTTVWSDLPSYPIGLVTQTTVVVDQSGTVLTWRFQNGSISNGLCDPTAQTFWVRYEYPEGGVVTKLAITIKSTFTMELVSRTKAW